MGGSAKVNLGRRPRKKTLHRECWAPAIVLGAACGGRAALLAVDAVPGSPIDQIYFWKLFVENSHKISAKP